jgi:hypothetical protein
MNSCKESKNKKLTYFLRLYFAFFLKIIEKLLKNYWKFFIYFIFEDFDNYYLLMLIDLEKLLKLTWCINFYWFTSSYVDWS